MIRRRPDLDRRQAPLHRYLFTVDSVNLGEGMFLAEPPFQFPERRGLSL